MPFDEMVSAQVAGLALERYRKMGHTISDEGIHDLMTCDLCQPDTTQETDK